MRMVNSPHPGDFVKTEVILPLGLTVVAAAKVPMFLSGYSDLSGTMTLRIEKAFGVKMDTLMRMRASHDIAHARRREADIAVARYRLAETRL